MKKNSLFWFRRDLRLQDNAGLYHALSNSDSVACLFVLDKEILSELGKHDLRVDFLWNCLNKLKEDLRELGSDLIVFHDEPKKIIPKLATKFKISAVYCNEDYEPKARQRDENVAQLLKNKNIEFCTFKDQVIFAKDEILNGQGQPYIIFTHYLTAWRKKFAESDCSAYRSEELLGKLAQFKSADLMSLETLGFEKTAVSKMKIGFSTSEAINMLDNFCSKRIHQYKIARDFPGVAGVSYLSVHNRFGTISIRQLMRSAINVREGSEENVDFWINELIWREFFFQVLHNFPHVAYGPFQSDFSDFPWENDMEKFQKWCDGETGYPLVDAAMKQLNQSGYMHNRLRMVTASFLTKHLLVDYRLGEQYFAAKLLDFDLSANNGGWQWVASTGCSAPPFYKIFNPILESEKFDPHGRFIKKMLPIFASVDPKLIHNPAENKDELEKLGINIGIDYPEPIIDHKKSRNHTLSVFKNHINKYA